MSICRVALIALLALCAPRAGAATPTAPEMPPELDRYIAGALRDWDVPGLALVIVKDDRVVTARGYGVRELGRPEPVDGDTIFDIASLTKSFTAAGAAVLVDAGLLRWDDRVRERLPAVTFGDPYIDHEVTLRDLLSHRTGLQPANTVFRLRTADRQEILRRVRFLEPQAPFRAGMVYSNILYTVAGEMTAAAAGTPWAELIRTRLLEPAGMRSTTVEARPSGQNVASPHALFGGVQKPIRPFDFSMVAPSSSIHTTAADLARWLRLQLNQGTLDGRTVISRAAVQEMHSPQAIIATTPEMRSARQVEFFAGYGLGWQIMDYRGEPLLWHTGNADGMPSYMALLPGKKLGVALMMNTWGAGMLHTTLMPRILDTYVEATPRDWSGEARVRFEAALKEETAQRESIASRLATATAPPRPLTDYAGTYTSDLWGEVHVRLEGEALSLQFGGGEGGRLSPWGGDSFHVAWSDPVFREVFYDTVVAFGMDGAGAPARLEMTFTRDRIEATRRRP